MKFGMKASHQALMSFGLQLVCVASVAHAGETCFEVSADDKSKGKPITLKILAPDAATAKSRAASKLRKEYKGAQYITGAKEGSGCSGSAEARPKPSPDKDKLAAKIIASHCSAQMSIANFDGEFLQAWAKAAGKSATFSVGGKTHWTAGGRAKAGSDPSSQDQYKGCVPQSGTELSRATHKFMDAAGNAVEYEVDRAGRVISKATGKVVEGAKLAGDAIVVSGKVIAAKTKDAFKAVGKKLEQADMYIDRNTFSGPAVDACRNSGGKIDQVKSRSGHIVCDQSHLPVSTRQCQEKNDFKTTAKVQGKFCVVNGWSNVYYYHPIKD